MNYKIKKKEDISLTFPINSGSNDNNSKEEDSGVIEILPIPTDADLESAMKVASKNNNDSNNDGSNRSTVSFSSIGKYLFDTYNKAKSLNYYETIHEGKEDDITDNRYVIDFGIDYGGDIDVNGRINQIYWYLKNVDNMDDVHIAALLANIRAEAGSYFNPGANTERLFDRNYKNISFVDQRTGQVIFAYDESRFSSDFDREGTLSKVKNSHAIPNYGGIGLLQWTGGKWDNGKWVAADNGADEKAKFLNWCNENNKDWYIMETQLQYMSKRLKDWPYMDDFLNIKDVGEATKYFCDKYEQPGDDSWKERIPYAITYLNKIKKED